MAQPWDIGFWFDQPQQPGIPSQTFTPDPAYADADKRLRTLLRGQAPSPADLNVAGGGSAVTTMDPLTGLPIYRSSLQPAADENLRQMMTTGFPTDVGGLSDLLNMVRRRTLQETEADLLEKFGTSGLRYSDPAARGMAQAAERSSLDYATLIADLTRQSQEAASARRAQGVGMAPTFMAGDIAPQRMAWQDFLQLATAKQPTSFVPAGPPAYGTSTVQNVLSIADEVAKWYTLYKLWQQGQGPDPGPPPTTPGPSPTPSSVPPPSPGSSAPPSGIPPIVPLPPGGAPPAGLPSAGPPPVPPPWDMPPVNPPTPPYVPGDVGPGGFIPNVAEPAVSPLAPLPYIGAGATGIYAGSKAIDYLQQQGVGPAAGAAAAKIGTPSEWFGGGGWDQPREVQQAVDRLNSARTFANATGHPYHGMTLEQMAQAMGFGPEVAATYRQQHNYYGP